MMTREVKSVLFWQVILVGITSLFFAFLAPSFLSSSVWVEVGSVLLGGGVAFFSALLYAFFAHTTKRLSPQELLKRHFRAEGLKLLATMLLFALVLLGFEAVSGLALLSGFVVAQAAYWFSLLSSGINLLYK